MESLGPEGIVEVLLEAEAVEPVAEVIGRLLVEEVVKGAALDAAFARSRADELGGLFGVLVGGLLGVVVGLFGGILPLTGGFVIVVERVFSGDLGPSAEVGFDEGVAARASGGAIFSFLRPLYTLSQTQ